jgi:hypothetical protein
MMSAPPSLTTGGPRSRNPGRRPGVGASLRTMNRSDAALSARLEKRHSRIWASDDRLHGNTRPFAPRRRRAGSRRPYLLSRLGRGVPSNVRWVRKFFFAPFSGSPPLRVPAKITASLLLRFAPRKLASNPARGSYFRGNPKRLLARPIAGLLPGHHLAEWIGDRVWWSPRAAPHP